MLGVVQPAGAQPRVHRVRVRHHRLEVVRDQHPEHTAEERPGRLAAGDHRRQGLRIGQPHEHVPAHHGGEDQRVHPPLPAGLGIEQVAHLGEVDLAFQPRLPVGHPDRGRPDPEATPLDREPVQRPIRHPHPLTREQLLDLHDRQRVPTLNTAHPGTDSLLVRHQQLPRRAAPVRTCRPHRLDHRADQLVGHRPHPGVTGQAGSLGRGDVPACSLAIHPRPLSDLPQPQALKPRPEHLTHLNHTDLPESHAR